MRKGTNPNVNILKDISWMNRGKPGELMFIQAVPGSRI